MAAKQKFYVVWQGREPGIYNSWDACRRQVEGVAAASYKAFPTEAEAQKAFEEGADAYVTPPSERAKKAAETRRKAKTGGQKGGDFPENPPDERHDTVLPLPPEVEAEAVSVDAACSGNPGKMEYRGIYLKTGQEIFHFGPVFGTNNIGEFLAIVHALALMTQQGLKMPIYSDSRNALLWVRAKKCRTKLERTARTEGLFKLIDRAEAWLKSHRVTIPLKKWETDRWGECPADFGRKQK